METKPSAARIALKWGLFLGLASVVLLVIQYNTFSMDSTALNTLLSGLGFVLSAALIYLAVREFRAANDGFLSVGQSISVGLLTGAISTVLGLLFQQFYRRFIDPNMMERMVTMQLEKQNIDTTSAQGEKALEFLRSPTYNLVIFGTTLLVGLLISLVIAAVVGFILRRERPTFS